MSDWFWRRVGRTESIEDCWPWLDTREQPVRAQTTFKSPVDGARETPHRYAWEVYNEQLIPWRGRLVRMCDDDVYCCNPTHYYLHVPEGD